MNSYIFVVSIVAIACATGVITTYFKTRADREQSQHHGAEFDETMAKIDALEERIRVIERIVTENRYDLKSEIEKL